MKILTAQQIRNIDAKTLEYNVISSTALMYQASNAFYNYFIKDYGQSGNRVSVVCGTGNNGGDGISVAIMLHNAGIKVHIYIIEFSEKYSEDTLYYYNKAAERNIGITKIKEGDAIPQFEESDIIIDAIFGTGLNRHPSGVSSEIIEAINDSGKTVVSIDIPSGMMMNQKTEIAVHATETITLQIPKLTLFLPDNSRFVGKLSIVDFGLSPQAIEEADTDIFYFTETIAGTLLKPLDKFAHKGTLGHSLIIGGSFGKIGSVCLASKAALKTGCGLVTAFVPQCGIIPLQSNIPEVMAIADSNQSYISHIDFGISPNAIGIGPGMGTQSETTEALHQFLKQNTTPLVIDADALNILSSNKEWLSLLPPQTILTPHPKELSRLIGEWENDFEKIEKVQAFAKRYKVIAVIKGAHTLIVTPDKLFVNSSGTPALATAGTGDVLTGIITSLRAQGYEAVSAALLGVYIHGATASITSTTINPRSFIASDVIDNIGEVYFKLENK